MTHFLFTLNNLNQFEFGILIMILGFIFIKLFTYWHKAYKNEGYKPFRPFRREGKTQSEDNFFIIMYMRSLLGIVAGYIMIIGGIISIIAYFKK